MTIRTRLTLIFSLLSGAILILSMVLLYSQLSNSLERDFISEMDHDSRLIAEIFKEEMRLNAFNEFREEISEFGIELQVQDENENIMLESDGWDESKRTDPTYALDIKEVEIENFGRYQLLVMRSKEHLVLIKHTMLKWMLGIIPFMIGLCALAGYFFSGRALKPMELAFEKLRRFTADASHELRIPLTALRGTLEVALRKDRSNEEYKQALGAALEEAEHLSHLTGDLLLLARGDSGEPNLNIESVDLKKFFTEIFDLSHGLNNRNKVTLKLNNLADSNMHFDAEKIRQLLLNLIDNAIKYSKPDGVVRIQSEISQGNLVISITDEGIGIPPEHLEKIFDRFYRVDKARSRGEGGTGLGLSIVQWIVQAHKGSISVDSKENQGTTFRVSLPVTV